jgi:hypothetical protein
MAQAEDGSEDDREGSDSRHAGGYDGCAPAAGSWKARDPAFAEGVPRDVHGSTLGRGADLP